MLAGRSVHLTKTEFRLLLELASAPGRVFSREQLLERVWDYDYFADGRIVDVHIRRLRAKIEEDTAQSAPISSRCADSATRSTREKSIRPSPAHQPGVAHHRHLRPGRALAVGRAWR